MLREFLEKLKERNEEALARAPQLVRTLGPILRKSATTGKVSALRRFCRRHGFEVPRGRFGLFRDSLIVQRIDMKDLEPAARERLRRHVLAGEDKLKATPDYLAARDPRCRDCRYFVTAPRDGDPADPNSTKSCVQMGTKGADAACVGFTLPDASS